MLLLLLLVVPIRATAAMVQRYAHLSPGHLRQAVEKLAPSAAPKRDRAAGQAGMIPRSIVVRTLRFLQLRFD